MSPRLRYERGQLAPLVGMAIVPLLGFAALAVDVGYQRNMQRAQQSAADSAAIAAASERAYPSSTASPLPYVTAARNDAASNGFTHDGSSTLVNVNVPPTTGSYTGDSTAVEVYVKVKHPTFFAGIFGLSNDWVTTRAVARLTAYGAGCIVALNTSVSSYTIEPTGGTVNASSCNIEDAGDWKMTGGTVNALAIGVAGTISDSGGTLTAGVPVAAAAPSDPCPTIAGCATLTNSPPATSPCVAESISSGTVTLNPGTYCSLTVSGGTVTLNSGLYVIAGSPGLQVSGGSVTGSGVTFYIASGASVNLTGGTKSLSAPTTGSYAGMLLYQVASNTTTAKLTGGSGSACPGGTVLSGIAYLPGAELDVTGGYWDPTAIIAGQLVVTGGGLTCMSSPAGGGASQIRRAVLAE